jgi:hypothetical protein
MRTSACILFSVIWIIKSIAATTTEPPPPQEEALTVYLPLFQKYTPNPDYGWFAGTIIQISGERFHLRNFTDVVRADGVKEKSEFEGRVRYFPSYIEFTFDEGTKSYYVLGILDGRRVLWRRASYEKWKQNGNIESFGVLYENNGA